MCYVIPVQMFESQENLKQPFLHLWLGYRPIEIFKEIMDVSTFAVLHKYVEFGVFRPVSVILHYVGM